MHVQSCFALYKTYLFFDILVVVSDVVAKAPHWFTLVPVNVPDF